MHGPRADDGTEIAMARNKHKCWQNIAVARLGRAKAWMRKSDDQYGFSCIFSALFARAAEKGDRISGKMHAPECELQVWERQRFP